jgi:hypothetical protein
MQANLQELDDLVNWEAYSFDGNNSPSTGVLCKWADGTIAYFDPRVHRGLLGGIRFIENDDPNPQKANKYVPWMEGGTEKEETIEGICGLIFICLIIGLLVALRCLGL